MRSRQYIHRLSGRIKKAGTGNKAESLLLLKKHGFRVPVTFILLAGAYDDFLTDRDGTLEKVREEIASLPGLNWAIRSSTSLEDSKKYSFAGQFETFTDIKGDENILSSVEKVWESVRISQKSYYYGKSSAIKEPVKCAVIIQEMVNSELSGVSFSRNPVNHISEIIIESVEGKGEELVQRGVTPLRWRIRDKRIIDEPDHTAHREIIESVAAATARLKKLYRNDVDIEWAYDGKHIYYLQIRPVTGPGKIPVYSNRMAREMLPGQIKPLVWSVNIPMVNGTWIEILSEITGRLDVKPEELAKPFYYRAYFNMRALGEIFRQFGLSVSLLEFMLLEENSSKPKFKPGIRTVKHLFRIILFIYSKLTVESRYIAEYKRLQETSIRLREKVTTGFTLEEYPELFNTLFINGKKLTWFNIIIPVLMQYYNRKLKVRLRKHGTDYELINFNRDFPQLETMNPMFAMNRIRLLYEALPDNIKEKCSTPEKMEQVPGAENLLSEFKAFLTRFGHLSDSGNDCSVSKWEESPDTLFDMIRNSSRIPEKRELINFEDISYPPLKKRRLRKIYYRAGRFKVYREEISSLFVFGYGLFRYLFLAVGKEFAGRGIIDSADDIFYLTRAETDDIVAMIRDDNVRSFADVVQERKDEMENSRDIVLPAVIIGDHAPIVERETIKNLKGVASSSGTFRGRIKIIGGVADFNRVQEGDVVVIPFSDVSWTPVLVKAGAIISESGGMLSHCSIIAREMGIPALVSVENACSLTENITVTVDGSNGILTIHDNE